jgi:hypothetical protein
LNAENQRQRSPRLLDLTEITKGILNLICGLMAEKVC